MSRLTKRNNREPRNPTKPVNEIQIGDEVIVGDIQFVVVQIDELKEKRCLVDKYACDYYVRRNENVEVIIK